MLNDWIMITKLKDKTKAQAFGLMSPEKQECLKKVGKKNCLSYSILGCWEQVEDECFVSVSTYAIKPDYQPELRKEK